ncbi:MAG: hypothetical protein ACJ757_08085 [Gaiellaceae bacterium]
MFRLALVDLNFQVEDGRYVRRFPPNSVTQAIYARFQANLPPLLRQTARLELAPWGETLSETARRLNSAGVDWWLTGSAALAVRGLAVSPRDLDLVVSDADAPRVATAFEDALIEPPGAVEGWFCRWWGRAWLGARVEWVGGVTEAADRPEPTDFGLVAAAALSEVRWQGQAIRVPPLELQREVSVRRSLSDRVQLIDTLSRR